MISGEISKLFKPGEEITISEAQTRLKTVLGQDDFEPGTTMTTSLRVLVEMVKSGDLVQDSVSTIRRVVRL